jgi:hypothetical protein
MIYGSRNFVQRAMKFVAKHDSANTFTSALIARNGEVNGKKKYF